MLLTQENAKEVLLDASMKKTVFLYFYQNVDQCAKATQAVTSQIADNNEYISLVQADIETPIAQSIAMQIGVQTIPTLIIWQQGRPTDMLQGDEIVTKLPLLRLLEIRTQPHISAWFHTKKHLRIFVGEIGIVQF